jgi:hypothetical protein
MPPGQWPRAASGAEAAPSPGFGGCRVRPLFRAAVTLAIVVSLVILVAGALFTSAADSYPGQALYPVKRFGENLRLSLTSNPAARQDLQTEYLLERRHEVRQVLDAGKRAVLEFRAELEEIGDDYWIIGGLKVMLDSDTLVEGWHASSHQAADSGKPFAVDAGHLCHADTDPNRDANSECHADDNSEYHADTDSGHNVDCEPHADGNLQSCAYGHCHTHLH